MFIIITYIIYIANDHVKMAQMIIQSFTQAALLYQWLNAAGAPRRPAAAPQGTRLRAGCIQSSIKEGSLRK